MGILELWLLYILVVIVAYILLLFILRNTTTAVRLFFALLIGALIVFIWAASVRVVRDSDRVWLGLLLLLAYILPIAVGIWIIWKSGYLNNAWKSMFSCSDENTESTGDVCYLKEIYHQTANGPVLHKVQEVCPGHTRVLKYD